MRLMILKITLTKTILKTLKSKRVNLSKDIMMNRLLIEEMRPFMTLNSTQKSESSKA